MSSINCQQVTLRKIGWSRSFKRWICETLWLPRTSRRTSRTHQNCQRQKPKT